MNWNISKRYTTAGDRSGDVYTLASDDAFIEVWPFLGFNCLRWNVRGYEVLYKAPDWDSNPVPTRSGHPILFPFPNRMKHARFEFERKTYQLPFTDSTGQHAIHGFTPKTAWRLIDQGEGSITGEFQLSKDKPVCLDSWPADCRIRVTYRVIADSLKVETVIDAADGKAMPFGLGFHPYFFVGGPLAKWKLATSARSHWESSDNFPSGVTKPDASFAEARAIGDARLDDLYGSLRHGEPMASLQGASYTLSVSADACFRELLLFTPPHRQAIAIEPYTCTTDAANLAVQGIESGWRVLPSGETYTSTVEYRVTLAE